MRTRFLMTVPALALMGLLMTGCWEKKDESAPAEESAPTQTEDMGAPPADAPDMSGEPMGEEPPAAE